MSKDDEDNDGTDYAGVIITCLIISIIFPPLLPIFVAIVVIGAFCDMF